VRTCVHHSLFQGVVVFAVSSRSILPADLLAVAVPGTGGCSSMPTLHSAIARQDPVHPAEFIEQVTDVVPLTAIGATPAAGCDRSRLGAVVDELAARGAQVLRTTLRRARIIDDGPTAEG